MDIPSIFNWLDIHILHDPTAQVFLWEIDKFLIAAELEMEKRGWRRHARFVWDKQNGVAPAFTVRYSHEYVVWWYKSRLLKPATEVVGKFCTVMHERGREHSRKPDALYSMVASMFPGVRLVDVFSREPRDGWEQIGDECDKFSRVRAEVTDDADREEGERVVLGFEGTVSESPES